MSQVPKQNYSRLVEGLIVTVIALMLVSLGFFIGSKYAESKSYETSFEADCLNGIATQGPITIDQAIEYLDYCIYSHALAYENFDLYISKLGELNVLLPDGRVIDMLGTKEFHQKWMIRYQQMKDLLIVKKD